MYREVVLIVADVFLELWSEGKTQKETATTEEERSIKLCAAQNGLHC